MLFPRGSHRFGAHPLPFKSLHVSSLLFRRISVNLISRPLHSNSQQVICFLLISDAGPLRSPLLCYVSVHFNSTAILFISMPMLIRASLCVSIPMHFIAKLLRCASRHISPRPFLHRSFLCRSSTSHIRSIPLLLFSLLCFSSACLFRTTRFGS